MKVRTKKLKAGILALGMAAAVLTLPGGKTANHFGSAATVNAAFTVATYDDFDRDSKMDENPIQPTTLLEFKLQSNEERKGRIPEVGDELERNPMTGTTGNGYFYRTAFGLKKNTVFAAQSNQNQYAVYYDLNGGDGSGSFSPVTVAYGNEFTVSSSIPTKKGYVFKYWADSKDENALIFYRGVCLKYIYDYNLILYAVWEPEEISISYDTKGGSLLVDTKGTSEKLPVITETVPTKEGYTFSHWSYADGSRAVAGNRVSDNTKLYANWKEIQYTIQYDTKGGSVIQNSEGNYFNPPYVTGNKPTKEGYIFDGWQDESGRKVYASTIYKKDVILYANWKEIQCTIKYDTKGGSEIESSVGTYFNPPIVTSWKEPTKYGYIFDGWIDENGKKVATGTKYKKDVTLYANWKEIQVTIKYDTNGGSEIADTVGTYLNPPKLTTAEPKRAGYFFNGWTDKSGYPISQNLEFTRDFTVYADWKKAQYVITYDTIGGSKIEDTFGNEANPPKVTTEIPVLEGCIFEGWRDWGGDGNSDPVPGTVYRSDASLRAMWTPIYGGSPYDMFIQKSSSKSIKLYDDYENINYSAKLNKPLSLTIKKGIDVTEIRYQLVKKGKKVSKNAWEQLKIGDTTVLNIKSAVNCNLYFEVVKAVDGGATYKTNGFTIDTEKPVISGVTNGKVYKKPVTIKVTDKISGVKSIKLNGKKIKSGQKVSKKGNYKLVVVDNCGNTKTIKFIIKK